MTHPTPQIHLRIMNSADWPAVAELIRDSTNAWYRQSGKSAIFSCGAAEVQLFCRVYEDLDPGCCVLAVTQEGQIAGSCFFHPRPTHVSLGIMNVHPDFFGRGIASTLLKFVTDRADAQKKPTRLVSSAMNLDSFSLYTRAGFAPTAVYQDMSLAVPAAGMTAKPSGARRVRAATPADASAIAGLEFELAHIRRDNDFRYFLENREGIWHTSVVESATGAIEGFLVSVRHPASTMLGPGVTRSEDVAYDLILAELDHQRGQSPVFLVPVQAGALVQKLYAIGARNCEIHFAQVRGHFEPTEGIIMPTFMPETG